VTATPSDDRYRLPRTITPHRYTLALEPNLDAATFVGHVVIDCIVSAPADSVVINAAELHIASVKVGGNEVTHSLDEESERLTLEQPVEEGPLAIEIDFTGTLNDKLRGWYRSTFTDEAGETRVIATSQMQATDCRRAFPCFDEPDFKAVFDVTLVVEPHLLALSNGPEVERTAYEGGKVAVRFAPTMPMSTYLVAVVVGPLEATEAVHVPRLGGGTIPLRVIHVPGKAHLTDYALEVGAFALTWFQEYYDIAYPTDKCDMLALPDFAAGAMENLGCITFREYLLLADPGVATQFDLQSIADVITHELAHMWFGDLVTMRWWNGIWLNEAFATFMEVACCAAFRPDWLRWTSFSLERSTAFEVDSLASTRSVEYPVLAPADCDGMFDVLTYQKGGSLLRMLEQYLGAEEFRQGVAHYLRLHSYANTETSDLWDAIEETNPTAPVRKLMDSWIWQPGYPLIGARLDGNTVVITQRRFAFGDTEDPTLFVVPLHVIINGVESKVLLDGYEAHVNLPSPDATVVVNAGGHGFLRVDYDDALRGRLTGSAIETLTVVDRYNLVDDAWNAVVAGRLAAADYLTFVEGFTAERDLAVWQAIAAGLRSVGRLVDGAAYTALQRRVATLVRPVLADIGWVPEHGESDLRAKLRGVLVVMLAVQGNDPDAQQRCRALLAAGEGEDPELTAAAISAVAAVGTSVEYEDYLLRWRSAATPQDQQRYLYSLGEFPGADEMERTIDLAFSDEVRTQNAPFLLARCLANRWQGALTWQRLRARWAEANERFPNNTISRMIDPVKLITAPAVVADVQSFFAEHDIPQAAKTLQQVLERQRVNAAVAEREADRLAASLTG
jgi:puromycin-sensitive aminopeptidase